ncbi:hypothetical protein HGH92_06005 [Chitinophaga varians]|uniref:Class I lanthipeptide n=1 Tax=Chitinophaga varians TaxID=2202339 RepID=A0A847RCR6_9BACT|nr:class I lanthipeptide [Chitinophaga varians]NLR63850.1 hypothetical protein [Chitinophaga varians]
MKKKKVNLAKLSLNKEVISNLSQKKITGGATYNGGFCSVVGCQPQTQPLVSCFEVCMPSVFCTLDC